MRDLKTAWEVFALFVRGKRVKNNWGPTKTAKEIGVDVVSIKLVEKRRSCPIEDMKKLMKFAEIDETWAGPVIAEKELENATI